MRWDIYIRANNTFQQNKKKKKEHDLRHCMELTEAPELRRSQIRTSQILLFPIFYPLLVKQSLNSSHYEQSTEFFKKRTLKILQRYSCGLASINLLGICQRLGKLNIIGIKFWGMAQMVRNLPGMQETWALSLDWEDPLGKGMATHSIILAWKIPWQRSLSSYYRVAELQRVGHNWVTNTSLWGKTLALLGYLNMIFHRRWNIR